VARVPVSAELSHLGGILTAREQLQGSARSDIEERCLFDDMPRASQWAGTWHFLLSPVLTIASEDSTSTAFHVAGSTHAAGPLFSIILTDPASTRAVRLSHRGCHFPAISPSTAETRRGVSRQTA
jgi:hypothetical protein